MRKKSDLKFSWDERQAGSQAEDWTLHKVTPCHTITPRNINSSILQIKIDGFDPDKFKAANTQSQGSRASIRTSGLYNTTTTSLGYIYTFC